MEGVVIAAVVPGSEVWRDRALPSTSGQIDEMIEGTRGHDGDRPAREARPPIGRPRRAEDGRVDLEVHQVVRDLAGRIVKDEIVRHVYAFEDGLIKSMDIVPK